jgi:hypothetical protein
MTYLLKEKRTKDSSILKHKRAKGSQSEKKHHGSKRKNVYSRLQKLLLQKVRLMWMWMNENQVC